MELTYDEKKGRVAFFLPDTQINSCFFKSLKQMTKFKVFYRLGHDENICSFYSNRPILLSQMWEENESIDNQTIIRLIECILFQIKSLEFFQVYLSSISMEDIYFVSGTFILLNSQKVMYEKNSIVNKLSSTFDSPELKSMSIPGTIPKNSYVYSIGLIVYTLFFNQCPYWDQETLSYIDPTTLLSVERMVENMMHSHFYFFLKRCFLEKELCFL